MDRGRVEMYHLKRTVQLRIKMILDAHTHICPPEIRKDREAFFDGEPNFKILYEDPRSKLVGGEELFSALTLWGADGACAFGFPFNDDDKTKLCNDYVLASAREYPGTVIPFACVNPMRGSAAVAEVERCLAAGAKGVGEIATYGEGLGEEVQKLIAPIAELCREAAVPLLLHTNEPVGHQYPGKSKMNPEDIYSLVKAHQETVWILAHMGGGLFIYHSLKKEASEVLRNVWYDTAAAPYLFLPEIFRSFSASAGIGKLLYGSDFPLLTIDRYKMMIEATGLSQGEADAILGENLAYLLGM